MIKLSLSSYKDAVSPFKQEDGCDYIGLEIINQYQMTRLDIFLFPLSMWMPKLKWKAFKLLATGIGFYCRLEMPSCDIRFMTSDGKDKE